MTRARHWPITPARQRLPARLAAASLLLLSGCEPLERLNISSITPAIFNGRPSAGSTRSNGPVYQPSGRSAQVIYGTPRAGASEAAEAGGAEQYSLDFADTDVREAVAQILGSMLRTNYSIDPAVKGTVTLRTARPLSSRQLLPALQTMLGSVGAVLIRGDGLYRVVPAAAAGGAGSIVVPLRYVSAEDLAKVLQPVAGAGTRIAAETSLNTLLVSGDPSQVQSMADLVRSFDIDALAGQSYAVLPVTSGNAKDFADALTESFRGKAGAGLSGLVRVIPLMRMNAVLIVSSQPRYIEAAQRVFGLIERERRRSVRVWHAYYLQNSNANDIAHTLQMAFTPNNVTASPQPSQQARGGGRAGGNAGGGGLGGARGANGGGIGGGAQGGAGGGGFNGGIGSGGGGVAGGANPLAPGALQEAFGQGNPLLGGIDPAGGIGAAAGGDDRGDSMRILPNTQNNAILVYGTAQEEETVAAMLRKIDIVPMQVRIDATIAEVTLNDSLQYGTQFFFKSGGINGILNTASAAVAAPAATVLGTSFPGFFLGGNGQGGAPIALSALQAVTKVNVLSSPQITVVDNQPARLQVGALVPYLTASSQSTQSANAPVINSIGYQPTGVIMEVTPRVNSGGLVTLDVSQEVSDVEAQTTTNGVNSPTFNQRSVTSRVVVQDGQTIGLAGLIRDSVGRGNSGIPWLKDIPILGVLAGTQNNSRQRTELLVLITPHVIYNQNDARALTEDMRGGLPNAAAVPAVIRAQRLSGSTDPNRRVRDRVGRFIERNLTPR